MRIAVRKSQIRSLGRLLAAIVALCTCLQYWLTTTTIGGHVDSSHHNNYFQFDSAIVSGRSNNLHIQNFLTTSKQRLHSAHHHLSNVTTATSSASCSSRIHATEIASDHNNNIPPPVRKWAYVFLVSGCGEKYPGYKGFVYNIMVAAERLREMGSKADVVLLVQMAYDTPELTLPVKEEQLLCSTGVKIRYLPKTRAKIHECFYAMVMEKFRILELVEYSRVLYIDSDVLPECNLDYLFELSEPELEDGGTQTTTKPLLKENLIVANNMEPSNGGFFMMRPSMEDWNLLQREVRRREENALELPWPHWDNREGWGHVITSPDYWRPLNGSKLSKWEWHGVFTDQGLLYYWVKYVKKSVSIVIGKELEQWGSENGGNVRLETIEIDPLTQHSCSRTGRRPPPYRDFFHFTGPTKPWLRGRLSRKWEQGAGKYDQRVVTWKTTLAKIHKRANATIEVPKEGERPPLGAYPTYSEMIKHIQLKKEHGWNQYQDEDDTDIVDDW